MNRTLIICRKYRDIGLLRRFLAKSDVIVASDDPRVQHAARQLDNVVAVSYVEEIASFYSVAPDVKRTVGAIDDWLAGFAVDQKEISTEVLRWGCTVEGGITSQRVQDTLLLINSYSVLLDRIRPSAVAVISPVSVLWEDRVLELVAARRGIPFRQLAPAPLTRLAQTAALRCRPWALTAYRLIHLLRQGGGRLSPQTGQMPGVNGGIVFVLCSNAGNHWENVRPVLHELLRQGAACLNLRWLANERMSARHAPRGPDRGDQSVASHQLESWVGLADILVAFRLSRQLRKKILRSSGTATAWQSLAHQGVPLASLLNESLHHFLSADLPARIVFFRALRKAIGGTMPAAVKPWGAPEGFEYRVISQLWPASHRPLILQYWLGVGMAWPYADPRQHLDLFLAKDAGEAAHVARDYQRTPAQIELVGQIRLAGHREFAETTSPATSRRILGLPVRPQALYVGFDPNCALRGYQSAREQAEITQALLAASAKSPDLVVVVKPHPAYPIDHLSPLFSASNKRHVVVLPHDAPLNHFLNAVDLVVSKYSVLLLEAALMRKVALAVIFDGDPRFRVFGELSLMISDSAALTNRLCQLADDQTERATWMAVRLRQQEEYLTRDYFSPTIDVPAARAAAAIITHADRHHSY
jgi:hypothetical protein